ncbi:hypothetical protein CW751_00095 [Brumimicrobium salinarum]|uniref:Uncharacterized protein n=1 Tax=Brumimicrobium salinarum TaxID=2058658 RepID=A0A2I0R5B2_9FLAO|nr:hypothetical protein [Brumimicrobium salinarum]PKR81777.1 hypothetical protein CW751_00095 [Brumimicrobium salinarum]
MTITQTHWRHVDYRADSLKQIITGLNNSIETLKARLGKIDWYDGLWLLEDTEPVFGMAFIAFQNYINGSIKDLYESLEDKTSLYKIGSTPGSFSRTNTELIIGLANYIKHKDDKKLHGGTQRILEAFDLIVNDDIEESPIFEGLTILDKKWDLFKVYEIVINWRRDLFNHYLNEIK